MCTRGNTAILGLPVGSLASLPRTAKTMPRGSPPNRHCYTKQPATGPLNAKNFAKHFAPFRRVAEEAWRATRNGDAALEASFSIEKDGHPGKAQLTLFATANTAIHLEIASNTAALGTLHVHNKSGEPPASAGDTKTAENVAQDGLCEIAPGAVFD
jgi:hypothetical protein